ncbi:hypothetical protein FDP41_008782 [Naegleria fowleri]|uniref:SMP-30/Gluconolactonase/LRE-like region domain-containing protein n=1 Tax=Naegleria fowleri TaxID=5763 RepID=A0A6A5BFY8_NAEFO|nr:uncharacterized protein FDP41_008782 [Naegleria fowleri]KAF0972930.1 hypothetical protein FDP41_008782 [Naegleria fowleri]
MFHHNNTLENPSTSETEASSSSFVATTADQPQDLYFNTSNARLLTPLSNDEDHNNTLINEDDDNNNIPSNYTNSLATIKTDEINDIHDDDDEEDDNNHEEDHQYINNINTYWMDDDETDEEEEEQQPTTVWQNGRFVKKIVLGQHTSEFQHPYDMVVDQHQELIFICDSSHHAIQVYDLSTHKFVRSIGLGSDVPFYIDYDPTESAIVFGSDNHCLYKYSVFGKLIWKVGKHGSGPGEFSLPSGVYIDTKEKLIYLCDQYNCRIQVLTSNGEFVRQFGEYGVKPGNFHGPRNITESLDGNLIITDRNNHRVQIFTKNGKFVKAFGSYGSERGQFNEPCSVLVEPNTGNIYVSDSFNDRIQIFSSNGEYIESIEGDLDYPLGISLNARNGDLMISEYSRNRIVILKDTKFESRMEEHFKRQLLYCARYLNHDIGIVSWEE